MTNWTCHTCGHSIWDSHSLNLINCDECPGRRCQPPAEPAEAP